MSVLNKIKNLSRRGLRSLREDGLGGTCGKVTDKVQRKLGLKIGAYTKKELEAQKTVVFPKEITFSVLVPLYNTPEQFLREMIESVQNQTYGKWQLCLADGSDEAHGNVGVVCEEYAEKDSRVCYRKLKENKGISGNTNACIEMATGEYIALFDHDDLLHPAALYEMMVAICEKDADFVYTDEDVFFNTPLDAYSPHYKPDFCPDTLRSYNYICHFTAFDRSLLDKTEGFRGEFDGSQDYDLFLRLTELAKCIVHIPQILYYWRNHAASTASDAAAKPYTMVSAKKALAEHLDRVGLRGTVSDSASPTTYRISYEIVGEPLVSVISNGTPDLQGTSYTNYELTDLEHAKGECLLFLDGAARVVTPDWIQELLMFAQRKDVGAVGGMVYDDRGCVLHGGQVLLPDGTVGFAHRGCGRGDEGYKFRMTLAQNYSAVSADCMMVRREVLEQCGMFDNSFGTLMGADFCMRARQRGYCVVWTPYAELIGSGAETTAEEQQRFADTWKQTAEDPCYNPRLSETRHGFAVK